MNTKKGNQEIRKSGCRISGNQETSAIRCPVEKINLLTCYPDAHCLITRCTDNLLMRQLMKFRTILFFLSIWSVCGVCLADRIVLKEGQTITGNILVEKEAAIYVDIGITVLSIPRDKILEYEYGEAAEEKDVNDVNNLVVSSPSGVPRTAIGKAETPGGQLYRTAKLQKTTIEKCVAAYSEAVVKVSSPAGLGSGFFINENGYLITNYHVIENETRIEVTMFQKAKNGFEKKTFKKVKIEAINPFVDLALLKVEDLGETKVKFAYLGDMERVQVGEAVFAIGNPLGLERTVTNGVISTKSRAFEGLIYIQTNADINPGNSGGPLFNLAGEVIGVTNMGYIFFGGLGFAIPIDYVKHFIENREAFAYDKDNPNTGFTYIQPDRRRNKDKPPTFLKIPGTPNGEDLPEQ
jgi:serine protease Do